MLSSYPGPFTGFFRAAPLHRWSLSQISIVLEFASRRPGFFGFPTEHISRIAATPASENVPQSSSIKGPRAAIVNTTHLLPSARGRQSGIAVFGPDRGCRSIIIPPSCSGHPFDATDVKMLEPLFRRNPSIEYLYLSRHCEPIAPLLAPLLKQHGRHVTRVCLPDWEDPAAITQIVMATPNCRQLDVMCPDEAYKYWNNEAAVEAMTEMLEMHSKLKEIYGTTTFLAAIEDASKFSRCKHQVALRTYNCPWAFFYKCVWGCAVFYGCYKIGRVMWDLHKQYWDEAVRWPRDLLLLVVGFMAPAALIFADHAQYRCRGRRWISMVKPFVLAGSRVARFRR